MTRSARWILIALMFVALCPWPTRADQGSPKAEELLARYLSFVDEMQVIAYDSLETTYEKGGRFNDWTWTSIVRSSFARAGQRWRILVREVGFNYHDGHKVPFDLEGEDTFDGKASLRVNRDYREARGLSDMDEESARKRLQGGGRGPMETSVSAEVDAEKPKAAVEYGVQNQTALLYGYIPFDRLFLAEILHQGTSHLTAGTGTIDGRPCEILKGVTSHGTVTLWLDPVRNDAPLRLRMTKAGNDLMDKTPMRRQKASGYDKGPMPDLPVRELEFQVDYRISAVGGRSTVMGYVRTDRFVYEGGTDYSRRTEANLDRIRFVPKPEDLEPTLPIADETRVYIRNAPGLRAKWSGGKLVMDYDKPTVASLKANWISEPSTQTLWRRPVVLIAIALSVLAAGTLVWRRRSRGLP